MSFKDSPEAADPQLSEDQNKLMHIALPIGKGNMLMDNDTLDRKVINYARETIFIFRSVQKAMQKLKNYSMPYMQAVKVMVPLSKQFWGSYFRNVYR